MRFSDAMGRQVMSTSTATTLGKVQAFVVDPAAQRVVALHLKKTDGEADTLMWSALGAFGPDAVTVAGPEALTTANAHVVGLLGKEHALTGKRILNEHGDGLGKVDDVDFDPESGIVSALLTKIGDIAGSRLIGVGSYAVVVRSA